MRFGPTPFKCHYDVSSDADFVACHKSIFVNKYDLLRPLKKGGTFILNSKFNTVEEAEKNLPKKMLK